MRINLLLALITALLLTSAPAVAQGEAEQITYLEHQKSLNLFMCKKFVECKRASDMLACQTRLNRTTEANPYNKQIMVIKSNSDTCRESLRPVPCKELMKKSISGPCELDNLQ